MKKILLFLLGVFAIGLSTSAQVQQHSIEYYRQDVGYEPARTSFYKIVNIPNIPGYITLKTDFHIHTTYSDGQVNPLMRVNEAYIEGLDAIAITDHQPTPRAKTETTDCNEAYNQMKSQAESKGLILIRGLEITSGSSHAYEHYNIIGVNDCNDYFPEGGKLTEKNGADLLLKGVKEGAIIIANHPGWPDKNSTMNSFLVEHMKNGNIHGVEVFNGTEFYPKAVEYANKYNIAHVGASDIHPALGHQYDLTKVHRPLTLVFAKEKTQESLLQAVREGRTIAWADNKLTGKPELLKSFLDASIEVVSYKEFVDNKGVKKFTAELFNNSDIEYKLFNGNPLQAIRLYPRATTRLENRLVDDFNQRYDVNNMYVGASDRLNLSLAEILKKSVSGDIKAVATQVDPVHYQLVEEYSYSRLVRKKIEIPEKIDEFDIIKTELHIHTVNSDGHVNPRMRILEAYVEGIDAISLTEHLPSKSDDCNLSFKQASKDAADRGITLIKGLELSGYEGNWTEHYNVHFIEDCDAYNCPRDQMDSTMMEKLIEKAAAEGAYITANHPGWPDMNSTLSSLQIRQIEKGNVRGIEVFNNEEFYPLCIDYAKKYNLSNIGATDAHYATHYLFDIANTNRTLTLIFSKGKDQDAIKEALMAGRTLAWADNILTGPDDLLRLFFHSCLNVEKAEVRGDRVHYRVINESEIEFVLDNGHNNETNVIPARTVCEFSRPIADLGKPFKVKNMMSGSNEYLQVTLGSLTVNHKQATIMPLIRPEDAKFTNDGLEITLHNAKGVTYYTTDGSEPTKSSKVYNGPFTIKESSVIKAFSEVNGVKSPVYCNKINFDSAVRVFKGRKQGLNYTYVENGKPTSGIINNIRIPDCAREDLYSVEYEGALFAPESGLYILSLKGNNGVSLSIAGTEVARDESGFMAYANVWIYLEEGLHLLKANFEEKEGGEELVIEWKLPSSSYLEEIPDANFKTK